MNPTIGVLALQGDFHEHAVSLRALGATTREVRKPSHLDGLDGLIIPGGESTTIARLMLAYALHTPVREQGADGLPIWGTCAGAILLADDVPGLDRPSLALVPMTVERNGFGRQIDSFETDLDAAGIGARQRNTHDALPEAVNAGARYHAVFIRAPRIRRVGPNVEVLMAYQGEPVAVRFRSLLATTFHPELTQDLRWHAYFLDAVGGAASGNAATSRDAVHEGVT